MRRHRSNTAVQRRHNPLAREYRAAIIDFDDAKTVIPEYQSGVGTAAVHEESSHLAGGVLERAPKRGQNVGLPKVGADEKSISGYIRSLKALGYTVDLVHVGARIRPTVWPRQRPARRSRDPAPGGER